LLALGLSLDRSTLLQYERGTVGSPDPVVLWGLSRLYRVAVDDLIADLVRDRTGRAVSRRDAPIERNGNGRAADVLDTMEPGGDAEPIDYGGALLIADMVRVLKTSDNTIRRRLRAGTFPIPPLDGIDNRLRWSGPVVKRWLDRNGPTDGRPLVRQKPKQVVT
jgi:transcriptional regulator with XRE-family HTH domain